MGTRISSTSLVFSTKKRNFWGEAETGGQSQGEGQLCPTLSLSWESPQTLSPSLRQTTARQPGPPRPAHLVEVAELPEEDQQLLVELDLLGGVGQVGLEQGVGEQPGYALEDELEVLGGGRSGACPVRLPTIQASWPGLPQMPPSPPGPDPTSRAGGAQMPVSSTAVLGAASQKLGPRQAGLESTLPLRQTTGSASAPSDLLTCTLDSCPPGLLVDR